MRYHTLNDLYVSLLRDLYSAEQQLLIALPVLSASGALTPLNDLFALGEGFGQKPGKAPIEQPVVRMSPASVPAELPESARMYGTTCSTIQDSTA